MNPENKICFFVNWLRELDMYEETYKNLPNDKIFFIINNLNKSRRNNKKEVTRIKKYFDDNSISNYGLLSQIKYEKKFRVLISTADLPISYLSLKSIIRFIFAQTLGRIIQFFNLDILLKNIFKKDVTFGGENSDIFDNKFMEKNLSKVSIKFPNGLDRNVFHFPDFRWKNIFDIYFISSQIEEDLIKKKFNNKKTFLIGYPRFDLKKKLDQDDISFNKEFNFFSDKRKIICLPNERIMTSQNLKAIERYVEILTIFSKDYNLVLRPHPKLQDINNDFYQVIKKSELKLDIKSNRNIFNLISKSDLILADYGNIVLESIYLKKKVIIYEWPNEENFRILNDKENCLDFIVRKKLKIINSFDSKEALLKTLNLTLSEKYQNTIYNISENLFDNQEIKKDINNLIKQIYESEKDI